MGMKSSRELRGVDGMFQEIEGGVRGVDRGFHAIEGGLHGVDGVCY